MCPVDVWEKKIYLLNETFCFKIDKFVIKTENKCSIYTESDNQFENWTCTWNRIT